MLKFLWSLICFVAHALWHMRKGNLNTETENSKRVCSEFFCLLLDFYPAYREAF